MFQCYPAHTYRPKNTSLTLTLITSYSIPFTTFLSFIAFSLLFNNNMSPPPPHMKRAREKEKPLDFDNLILVEVDVSTLTLKFRRVEHTKTHEEEKPIREEHTKSHDEEKPIAPPKRQEHAKNHDGDKPESPHKPWNLRGGKKVLAENPILSPPKKR